jgi:hypothetical protein
MKKYEILSIKVDELLKKQTRIEIEIFLTKMEFALEIRDIERLKDFWLDCKKASFEMKIKHKDRFHALEEKAKKICAI